MTGTKINTLSIIIPTYNEEKTIHRILGKIRQVKLINDIKKEIIIVNDFSSDNTGGIINEYIAKHQDTNICYFKLKKTQVKELPYATVFKMQMESTLLFKILTLNTIPISIMIYSNPF